MTGIPRSDEDADEPVFHEADQARVRHLLRQFPASPALPSEALCTELVQLARQCHPSIRRTVCDALWPQLWQRMQFAHARWTAPAETDPNPQIRSWARHPCRARVDALWPFQAPFGDELSARKWAIARCLRLFAGRNVCNASVAWESSEEFLARFTEECDLYIALNLASGPRKVCRLLARHAARDRLNEQMIAILHAWEARLKIHSGSFASALLTQEWIRTNFRYLISRKTITCRETGEETATYWEHAGAFLTLFSNLIYWRLDGLLKSARGQLRDADAEIRQLGDAIESVAGPGCKSPAEIREFQQEEATLRQRQFAVIRAAVSELPPPLPEVFCASYFIRLDDRDIAQMWSLPRESVRGLMTLCEKALRFLLGTDPTKPAPQVSQADADQHLYTCAARCVEQLVQLPPQTTDAQRNAILTEFQCDYLRLFEGR